MRTVAEALNQQIERRREQILRLENEIVTLGYTKQGLGALANELRAREIHTVVNNEPLQLSVWLYGQTPESRRALLLAPRDLETVTLLVFGEDGEVFSEDSEEACLVVVRAEEKVERSNILRINLTRRLARPGQRCISRTMYQAELITELLTFGDVPTHEELVTRAHQLADIATKGRATEAMIDGPPYLVLALDRILREHGVLPVYAFKETVVKLT